MEESRASGHAGHAHPAGVSPDDVWLSATWPFVHGQLPPPPAARVVELGCGPVGGHVPSTGPFYFPDLADAGADAEQAAIDAGQIRAGCLRYAGRVR